MNDNRKPAPKYRFNAKGGVVFDDRTNGPKTSSPARIAFKAARFARRVHLHEAWRLKQEAARLNSPAAIAARIASASVKA